MALDVKIQKPNLTNYQKHILYNDARFTVTEASTKVGKTFSHIWWIFERAHLPFNKPGYNHWWVAPVYSQAKIAFKRLKNRLSGKSGYKFTESNIDLKIVCPNKAVITFKSAKDPNALYGEDVYSIVFDEAPRAKVEAHYALRTTITATKGIYKLIGNFGGSANWMHQLKSKSESDPDNYKYFKVTAWDAVEEGVLTEEDVLQAQKDLPPKVFKQLYLAEEQDNPDQLISNDVMECFFTNTHVKKEHGRFITSDVAFHGSDRFVIFVWHGWVIIEAIIIDKCDSEQVERYLRQTAEKHSIMQSNIVYDADGVGIYLKGYLKKAKSFNTNAKVIGNFNYKNLKSQCGYEFAKHVNKGLMAIECDIDKSKLFEELQCLRSYELDKEGKMQLFPKSEIKEIIGRSPDMLDAIIMRMYFELKKKKTYSIYASS